MAQVSQTVLVLSLLGVAIFCGFPGFGGGGCCCVFPLGTAAISSCFIHMASASVEFHNLCLVPWPLPGPAVFSH